MRLGYTASTLTFRNLICPDTDGNRTILLLTSSIIKISPLVPHQGPLIEDDRPPVAKTSIPCHSHNDYWREEPLFSALAAGCIGVEADIWPYRDDLYIAHTRGNMKPGFTLKSIYIDPLRLLLQDRNCAVTDAQCNSRGLYEGEPLQTIVLLIDIKANPLMAWPILAKQLEPLRRQGWLSTIQDGQLKTGPITIVISGRVLHASNILETAHTPSLGMFFDASLKSLDKGRYNSSNSYWASASLKKAVKLSWLGKLGSKQRDEVRRQLRLAHGLGLRARYWGLPSWPAAFREDLWRLLLDAGLDLINVDDVGEFARFWRRYKG